MAQVIVEMFPAGVARDGQAMPTPLAAGDKIALINDA